MRIDKDTKKEFEKKWKEVTRQLGYKSSYGYVFSKVGENFVRAFYVFTDLGTVVFDVSIKKYSYDDLLWDAINLSSNKSAPMSLRASGAFAAPTVPLFKDSFPALEDIADLPNKLGNILQQTVSDFITKNTVNEHVMAMNDDEINAITLKCLSFLDTNHVAEAICLAKKVLCGEIENRGRGFQNEDKSFFEWLACRK